MTEEERKEKEFARKYKEIADLFGFTGNEDKIIDDMIKKFISQTTIGTKVTVAEKESIKTRAELEGMTLNDWVYKAIVEKMSRDYTPKQ